MSSSSNSQVSYINEKGILFNADCMELLKGIKSESIDLVFTDPPFNVGKDYKTSKVNDNLDAQAYRQWCQTWALELCRVLKPGGTLAIYCYPKIAFDLGSWLNTIPTLQYRSMIALKMKSGFPIRGRLHPAHYSILYYTKKGASPTFNVVRQKTPTCRHCGKEIRDYGGYRGKFKKFEDENGIPWIQISDFWEDTRPARQDKSRTDINELPIHIPERIILMGTKENDIVLDIFGGGGGTYHAAQLHNRYWIGTEIGDVSPILSRFATVFGRDEKKELPRKVKSCFRVDFIKKSISTRRRNSVTVKNVKRLDNGHSLEKDDIISKSKVLGY